MTLMLASVLSADEAEIALRHGADVIDLKDPRAGALGALDLEAAGRAIVAVARRRSVSATLGDPPYEAVALAARARALAAMGVDTLKMAVDGSVLEELAETLAGLARETALVGMVFADEAPDFAVLEKLARLGFKGAMLDTRAKGRGRLIDHLDVVKLEDFCARCRKNGLFAGLAGSLEAPDVPRLLLVRPEVLGFRGALCRGHERGGQIDPQAVDLIRDLIPRERDETVVSAKIDWRLLARGLIGGRDPEGELDRVFVKDFAVEALIGAYDFERHAPQRVVFDVEARVRRAGVHADDMRAIFSYDLILDAIRLVVARGHVDFVETLVEEVASVVLAHPRVRNVRVAARKLDVIGGSVGVEIQRERAHAASDAKPQGLVIRGPTSSL